MKLAIIVGSHRPNSQSAKVGSYLANAWKDTFAGDIISTIDLGRTPLPLWSEEMWQEGTAARSQWAPYHTQIASAEAFIIIAPEWGGMVPAALKNFFLYAGNSAMGHKPALIVGVTSGRSGAYPIAELRMSSYKNTFICYIPEHLIVREVEDVLNTTTINESERTDAFTKKRALYCMKLLRKYSEALTLVRESGLVDLTTYPFGM